MGGRCLQRQPPVGAKTHRRNGAPAACAGSPARLAFRRPVLVCRSQRTACLAVEACMPSAEPPMGPCPRYPMAKRLGSPGAAIAGEACRPRIPWEPPAPMALLGGDRSSPTGSAARDGPNGTPPAAGGRRG